jgi:general secretion pathway protein G
MAGFRAREDRKWKSEGFTLVELLVALVIVGILAGALLLVSSAGADKAQAARVVSDLRNLKAAAVEFNASSGRWPSAVADLSGYLDGPLECKGPVCYEVASGETGTFIGFTADLARAGAGLKDRLKGMAGSVALYSDTALTKTYAGEALAIYPVSYAGSGTVATAGGTSGTGGTSETSGTSGTGGTSETGVPSGAGSGETSPDGGSSGPSSDPAFWATEKDGLTITRTAEGIWVRPQAGYQIKGSTLDGKSFTLTNGSGFALFYKGADGNWYYEKNGKETPVDIGSLQIIKT